MSACVELLTPQISYQCGCGHQQWRPYVSPAVGGMDGSARCAGWRIGTARDGRRVEICPKCAGGPR